MPSILENLSLLEVVKETSSYIKCVCPVCGQDGLKISLSTSAYGAYRCYDNECSPQDIRKALGILDSKNYHLSPYKDTKSSSVYQDKRLEELIYKANKVPFVSNYTLISCPDYQPIISTTRTFVGGSKKKTTIYPYSSHQRVYRLDSYNPPDKKQVYLQTLDSEGSWEVGLGPHTWQIYDYNLSLSNSVGDTVLAVEGEKTAEFVKDSYKKACITFASPAYSLPYLYKVLFVFFTKYKNVKQIIYVPDHDDPGYLKASKVQKVCWYLKKPCQVVSIKDFLSLSEEPSQGCDLADFSPNCFSYTNV